MAHGRVNVTIGKHVTRTTCAVTSTYPSGQLRARWRRPGSVSGWARRGLIEFRERGGRRMRRYRRRAKRGSREPRERENGAVTPRRRRLEARLRGDRRGGRRRRLRVLRTACALALAELHSHRRLACAEANPAQLGGHWPVQNSYAAALRCAALRCAALRANGREHGAACSRPLGRHGTHRASAARPISQRRCGRDEPGPGADVPGVSPVPMQMWPG
jgi:hypothetical protein